MVRTLVVRLLLVALVASCPLCCLADVVLLDFSSPTCGPCQQMRPTVERLKRDGLPVREVDISREPQVAQQFGVSRVPTFLVVVDGRVVDRVVGPASYRQLHRMITQAMPAAPPRPRVVPQGQSPTIQTSTTQTLDPFSRATNNSPNSNQQPPASANPFGNPTPGPTAPVAGSLNNLHQQLLAATVKISVDDADGKSAGTGTIVDTRSGEALVLTCGHIFRSSAGKGPITVTTFQPGPAGAVATASYAGRLIDFDLERDLALLSIRPTAPVQAVSIATTSASPLSPGVPVTSVGCNHGDNPTVVDSRVTTVDRYQGTPNVEVAGAPVEGRSGGGLFNAQGQLVGVCYAADPQANEGLYVSLPAIYTKLDSLGLTMIYRPQPTAQPAESAVASVAPPIVTPASLPPQAIRGQEPEPQPAIAQTLALSSAELAALHEIQRRGANSEVICIIRPQDPNGKSEVITLNQVSPAFVQALTQSAGAQMSTNAPTATAPTGQLLR